MSIEIRKFSSSILFATTLAALAVASSGCGKQQFVVSTSMEQQQAPGHFLIPPKVDIVVAIDNSGSMAGNLYNSVKAALPGFLTTLDAKNWDYHLAAFPLVTPKTVDFVTASRHDSNYGSQWIAPFPGAQMWDIGTLNTSYFLPLSQFLKTELIATPDNTRNGSEPGFKTILSALTQELPRTGFMRDDAMLVVLALSSGEDTSDVVICERSDGVFRPFEKLETAPARCYMNGSQVAIPAAGTRTLDSSFNSFKTAFQGLKPRASQMKFYSAVNTTAVGVYKPERYMDMAAATGGAAYNISNVGQVLDSLSQSLNVQALAMRTHYLFISQDAEVSSIQVTKYVGGDVNQAVTIPQDATNGWTYAGWLDNAYAIDLPIPMNQRSGYAIELHGSAKLTGYDSANVSFKPAGSQDTVH